MIFKYFLNSFNIFASILLLVVVILFRFYDLDLRPFHNDEAVNHFFLKRISELGFYPYSHENYHGPLYFYFTWFFFFFLGDSEFVIRLSAVLIGIATLFLPLMVQKIMGWKWVVLVQLFLATSASTVYYHRYAIHESMFLFFTMLLAFSIMRYFEERKQFDLILILVSMASLVCVKETYIITFFTFGLGALYLLWKKGGGWPSLREMRVPLFLFFLLIIFCYSGGFQWSKGLKELVLSVPQWMERNESDIGHFKPWGYYFHILWGSSFLDIFNFIPAWRKIDTAVELASFLVIIFIPITFYLIFQKKECPSFAIYGLIFFLVPTIIYSFPVQYKTPWLIMNITFPLYCYLAWQIVYLWEQISDLSLKVTFGLILLVALGFNLFATIRFNFLIPYQQERNPLAYVHPYPEMREFAKKLEVNSAGKSIMFDNNSYWPLPYYLRNYTGKANYYPAKQNINNCSLLKDEYYAFISSAQSELPCPYEKKEKLSLADNIFVNVYYFQPSGSEK